MDAKQKREELIFQLKEIFANNKEVYIYGAGIVGKRLYEAIHSLGFNTQLKCFIVSEIGKKSETQAVLPIMPIDYIKDLNACILIAVSDAYQNEIEHLLKTKGFCNYFNAYMFSYINEEHIPEDIPLEVPNKIMMNVGELMMEQFEQGDFCRYDALLKENSVDDYYSGKCITVDNRMRICDSAEQIAALIKSGKQYIEVKRLFDCKAIICNQEWAEKNLTREKVSVLNNILLDLKKEWNREYVGIIWPPAYELRKDIIDEMAKYVSISRMSDMCLSRPSIIEFINRVYKIDDVEEWQIELKRERIIKEEKYNIRVIYFFNENPKFHIKRFGHTISQTGMDLKKHIRDKYKKNIIQYTHDVILHTTDNYDQSDQVKAILEEYNYDSLFAGIR